jgi:uncharacterized protein (TIGR02996 family)
MTADATALVRAVLESPADDAPRLVFADYLEEQGDPVRAEFIRLQIAGAQEPCVDSGIHPGDRCDDPNCRGCRQFRDRAAELLRSPGFGEGIWGGWDAPVAGVWFERGFVEEVSVVAERFVETAGRLFALHPIRAVRLSGRMPRLSSTAAVWIREQPRSSGIAQALVPTPVFELLEAHPVMGKGLLLRGYPTHEVANRALSEACVRFGRREAGLAAKWTVVSG